MSLYSVEIDGEKIKNYNDFISEMQMKFKFPRDCQGYVDRYLDWMRDLSWIKADKIKITVRNVSHFMVNNPADRKEALQDLYEIILPFWKLEADKVIVGGKKRDFTLSLTN